MVTWLHNNGYIVNHCVCIHGSPLTVSWATAPLQQFLTARMDLQSHAIHGQIRHTAPGEVIDGTYGN